MALIPTGQAPDDYRRKLAYKLMLEGTDASPVQHWAQGLARMGQGALGGYEMYQADQRDREDLDGAAKMRMDLAGAGGQVSPQAAPVAPSAPPMPTPSRPLPPQSAPMVSADPQAATGPRPGGPVMPTAKVWGDAEAEAAGIYEPSSKNVKLASALARPEIPPQAPMPAGPPAPPAPQMAQALAPQAAPQDPRMARVIHYLENGTPAQKREAIKLSDAILAQQIKSTQFEKLNESTLFDPRTGRSIAVPGAEKPTVVGKDQRLVKDGKVIVDQQPDKAVKITLLNGQEVTAIQNPDGSFKIPEVKGSSGVTPKLSEGERDQIIKDEDTKSAGESAMSAIREARKLNDTAFSGAGAGARSWVARNSPVDLGFIPGVGGGLSREGGKATTQLDNLLTEQALGSMKAIFGGNPTEGERKVLLDLQASSSKSPAERKEILDRAEKMMARRIQMSGERANSIRGGSYFKPGGGTDVQANPSDALKQKYGLD